MARESELWSWLAKARLHFKMNLHMHRIENPVSPGMPDVEGYLRQWHATPGAKLKFEPGSVVQVGQYSTGGQFWFELKTAARPAKASTPIRFKMRPKQVEWAKRRWALGGACYWLLQVGHGGNRRIYMLDGGAGEQIAKGMTEDLLAARDVLRFWFEAKPDPVKAILSAAARA